jgi:hypothetical protein
MNLKMKFSGFDNDYLEMISKQKKEDIVSMENTIKRFKKLIKDIKAELKRRDNDGDYVGSGHDLI